MSEPYIHRMLDEVFASKVQANKVMLILGPRRVGKTSFIRQYIKQLGKKALVLDGEDMNTQKVLAQRTVVNYKRLVGKTNYLVIDEAQKIPDIGMVLKLMVDEIPGIKIIVTGSSMFDLNNQTGEPLTGRKKTFFLFPLAQAEYAAGENYTDTVGRLEERIVYGNYPELVQYGSNEDKTAYLNELVSSYLLKDILDIDGIRNSSKMLDLLRLLAFQLGKEVSYDELGRQLGMSKNTVERYLDLLSKVFVLFKVQGFSRNLRKEITKSPKWYFYDTGVRNALVANFNPLSLRTDTGELWENFVIAERIKFQHYKGMSVNNYFWRTYDQQEIDWVEDRGGKLYAFEIKWKTSSRTKVPSAWQQAYPAAKFQTITPENYLDWVM